MNLAARLQSATEPGSILLSHETNALVQGLVMTEEQPPITVKGFPKPISGYKLVGTYNDLVKDGKVVLEERDGLHVLVDLTKQDRSDVIEILQDILTKLKRPSGRGKKTASASLNCTGGGRSVIMHCMQKVRTPGLGIFVSSREPVDRLMQLLGQNAFLTSKRKPTRGSL